MPPIFNFTDSTWVEVIWYVTITGSDLLGVLFRELPHGPWQLRYRFRHYTDERVWDDDDVKHVYDINPDPDDSQAVVKEKLMRAFDAITEAGAKQFGGEIFRIVVRGHAKKAIKILSRQAWAHTKEIPFSKMSARIH